PLPTSVTIAKRPSCGNGTATVVSLIWVNVEAEYFFAQGWTGFRARRPICPSGNGSRRRMVRGTITTEIFTSNDVSFADTSALLCVDVGGAERRGVRRLPSIADRKTSGE